jgi:hypothetical protein
MTTNKIYSDGNGVRIFVSCNIATDEWLVVRQKKAWKETHRIKSPALPIRKTLAEAQNDLDAYAKRKGWKQV